MSDFFKKKIKKEKERIEDAYMRSDIPVVHEKSQAERLADAKVNLEKARDIKKSQASVSAKLASKIGVNAGSRVIPIASGVISGLLDAAFTRGIGEIAKKAFEDIHDEMYVEFREIKD